MAIFMVEARRTYEWGGYYEADTPEEAKEVAGIDMQFDVIVDEQMIALVVEDES
jgi:hypothetical protein